MTAAMGTMSDVDIVSKLATHELWLLRSFTPPPDQYLSQALDHWEKTKVGLDLETAPDKWLERIGAVFEVAGAVLSTKAHASRPMHTFFSGYYIPQPDKTLTPPPKQTAEDHAKHVLIPMANLIKSMSARLAAQYRTPLDS